MHWFVVMTETSSTPDTRADASGGSVTDWYSATACAAVDRLTTEMHPRILDIALDFERRAAGQLGGTAGPLAATIREHVDRARNLAGAIRSLQRAREGEGPWPALEQGAIARGLATLRACHDELDALVRRIEPPLADRPGADELRLAFAALRAELDATLRFEREVLFPRADRLEAH